MMAYIAFTKKELYEFIKTYKLLIMLVVFMLLGFMNPITAKFTPMLLESVLEEGIKIELPEPTIMDSWMQFFKNVNQMGLIILAIMFSGLISNEINRNTLINMLTKGLPRKTVILSKFTSTTIIWTILYYIAFFITFLYSKLFWDNTEVEHLGFAVNIVWIFGVFLISLLILGGVLFKSSYGALIFCGIIVFLLFMLKIVPAFDGYNVVLLISKNLDIINESIETTSMIKPICVSTLGTISSLILSIIVFSKSEL